MKKYVLGFNLEGKKFEFETFDDNVYFKRIKFKGYNPEKFTYLDAEFEDDILILSFRAGNKGDTLKDLLRNSHKYDQFEVKLELSANSVKVPETLEIVYFWREYNDGKACLAPEKCGKSILVGV